MKILVIKTSALGDIVQTFPAIQFLKEVYPSASIDWVVEKAGAPLLHAHPLINRVLVLDTKNWRKAIFSKKSYEEIRFAIRSIQETTYDVVFDFQGNIKSSLVTYFAKSPYKVGFGKRTVSEKINCLFTNFKVDPPPAQNIRLDYLALVEGFSKKKAMVLKPTELISSAHFETSGFNIMVAPCSIWANKELDFESLLSFLQKIEAVKPCHFWLIYGKEEELAQVERLRKALQSAQVVKPLAFADLQKLMLKMDQVIAMDSFPLHLAAEAAVPTFSIFGASSAIKYKPISQADSAFQGVCPYGQTFPKRCPLLRTCKTGACIHGVSVEALFQKYINS